MRATLTSKSQFTLPAEIRRKLGLGPGDQLDFTLHDESWLEVRPVKKREKTGSVMDLIGILGPPPNGRRLTLEEMEEAIMKGAAEGNLPPCRAAD